MQFRLSVEAACNEPLMYHVLAASATLSLRYFWRHLLVVAQSVSYRILDQPRPSHSHVSS